MQNHTASSIQNQFLIQNMHLLTNKRQRETLGRMMPCSSTLLRPPRCLLGLVIEIFVASLTSSIFIFNSDQICCNISCLVNASYLYQHALPYCSSLTSAYHLIYTCLGLFFAFHLSAVCVCQASRTSRTNGSGTSKGKNNVE